MNRSNAPESTMAEIPRPTPGKGGAFKLLLFTILACLLLGVAALWLFQSPESQDNLREQAATTLDDYTKDTLLQGLGNIVRKSPPPPPEYVTNPRTNPGTLAGQNVQGSVGVPIGDPEPTSVNRGGSQGGTTSGLGNQGVQNGQPGSGATIVSSPSSGANPYGPGPDGTQAIMPKVKEDSRVRADLVDDLAGFLVSRYKPAGNGQLNVTVKNLNHRYGQKVNKGEGGGRAGFLRYAFQPTMLNGLYGLYVNRFLEALDHEARAKNFSATQTQQLHTAIAGRALMVASALEAIVESPNLANLRANYDKRTQEVVDINAQMTNATFELDEMRENNAPRAQLAAGQLRVDGLAARYRRSLDERQQAQRQLVGAIRKGAGQSMDDESLLFLVQWVGRRMNEGNQAKASVQSAASILRDLSRRCASVGNGKPIN